MLPAKEAASPAQLGLRICWYDPSPGLVGDFLKGTDAKIDPADFPAWPSDQRDKPLPSAASSAACADVLASTDVGESPAIRSAGPRNPSDSPVDASGRSKGGECGGGECGGGESCASFATCSGFHGRGESMPREGLYARLPSSKGWATSTCPVPRAEVSVRKARIGLSRGLAPAVTAGIVSSFFSETLQLMCQGNDPAPKRTYLSKVGIH